MDGSEFGRYGVLRFMRRHEETVIASYPIDDDELTFGCDPSCSVRLYYPTISPIHAKIIFQERKAFIEVVGVNGLLVDNCAVFPASATTHTTVPLTNNSELEISKKRFRFEYPPKALRPVLAVTPPPHVSQSARKRVLRLSMIQSAHVFTPRPDPDPHVNLRILQTPIRLNSSPLKHVHQTPGQTQAGPQEEEFGTPFRLVEGNCPQVVEEEQDLVILEEVDAPEHLPQATPHGMKGGVAPQSGFVNPMQSPAHIPQMGGPYPAPAPAFPLPASHQLQQFQTPRRRPGRPSLHRAVLIRSAQRAAMRIEIEKEQEQEEREVEDHVIPLEEQMEVCEEDQGDRDAIIEEFDEDEGDHEEGDGEDLDLEPTAPVFGWRKGLEAFKSGLQVLRSRSRSPEKNEHTERDVSEARVLSNEHVAHHTLYDDGKLLDQDGDPQELEEEEDFGDVPLEHEAQLESETGSRAVSLPRQFTPQRPERPFSFMTPQVTKSNGGLSLADRVRGRKSTGGVGQASLTKSWRSTDVAVPDIGQSTPGTNVERKVSDSERQAIQERRRSALTQPDTFFGENIPGSRRNSLGSGTPGAKAASIFTSPSKTWATIKEDEEEAETTTLLEKMREVVEDMQRRRSIQPDAIPNIVVSNTLEEDVKDAGQQDETLKDDEASAEELAALKAEFRSTAHSFPATPHMSDLKHVFSENHAANMPPSYGGVRDLFKTEPAMNPETPRLDGVREMFFRARDREPSTPIFEGVGEMLATPAGYFGKEVETESTVEAQAPAPSIKRPRGRSTVADHTAKPGSRIAVKAPNVRPMRDGRITPADVEQLADDEMASDVLPTRHPRPNANAPKASTMRRTRTEMAAKQDTTVAPTKPATKARKVVTPEEIEHAPPQSNLTVPEPGPARRSRTATKSTESTMTESEPAEASKSTRKKTRGTKAAAATAPAVSPDPDANLDQAESTKGPRRGGRTRSQSVEVAPAPAPAPAAPTKRRVGPKSKKTAVASTTRDALAKDGSTSGRAADRASSPEAPPAAARVRRGKTKPAAETEDEATGTGTGTGALRVARGKRTPTGTGATATGAASNRAPTGKGRAIAVAVVIPSSTKSAARAVVAGEKEKENTPERVHVKDEEDDKATNVALQPVAVPAKGARARKMATVVPKAQSEPEKDTVVAKTRAPRTRAASGRK